VLGLSGWREGRSEKRLASRMSRQLGSQQRMSIPWPSSARSRMSSSHFQSFKHALFGAVQARHQAGNLVVVQGLDANTKADRGSQAEGQTARRNVSAPEYAPVRAAEQGRLAVPQAN